MEADTPAVNELLSALSPREQEVIFLRLSEMKYRDIAKELGISSSSVNTLLARAVRKLQVAASKATGLKRWKKARQDEFPQTLQ
jgi:RNA polymerase sigma factor (sigma-70 family)